MDLLRTLAARNPNALLPVGLEDALVGIGSRNGKAVGIYDERRCLNVLCESLSADQAQSSIDSIRCCGANAPFFATFAPNDRPLPSASVRAMIGTLTESAQSPILTWATAQLRTGSLRPALDTFVAQNPHCDPRTVIAEALTSHTVHGRFPVVHTDHESPSPFRADVRFVLDLASQEIRAEG